MDFRNQAIKLMKSHMYQTCSIIMLALLIISFQLLQTLWKNHCLSDFSFDCISTFSNTTQWEYHIAFIFLKYLSLVLQLLISLLKSSITLTYALIHPPLYWNIIKITKFCCPGTQCPVYTASILLLPFFFIIVCSRSISELSNCTWKSTEG